MGSLGSAIVYPTPVTEPDIITDMIEDRIDSVSTLVTTAYNAGINAINALAGQTFEVDWDEAVFPDVPDSGIGGFSPVKPIAPVIGDPGIEPVEFTGVTPASTEIAISTDPIPDHSPLNLNINVPDAPTVAWPVFTKDAPSVSDPNIPTVPAYDLPAVPVLTDISIPSPPEYSIPEFDGVLPVDDLTPPDQSLDWAESYYTSGLKDALVQKLYDGVVNGGTGLSEETEQAIYDRAESRQETERQAMLDSISDGLAQRGFEMPPGALVAANLEAENKILRDREDLNNDILIQQSKLAQENTHFVLEAAKNLEGILITYHSQAQQRSLDAAKAVIETAVQMYSLKVEGYKAKILAYQTMAEVYKARITGEIAKAEFFKAQIAGVTASVQAQALMIEAYKAQVNAVEALMQVYRTQMEGAQIQAQVDATRIQAYLGEVQAYSEKTRAIGYRFEGYKAQISGEVAKASIIEADSNAYVAQVSGYKAKADVEVARAEVALNNTRSEVQVYLALIEKYKADVQKAVSQAEIQAQQDGIEVEAYKAETAMYSTEINALLGDYQARVEEAKASALIASNNSEIGLKALLGEYELTVEALKAVATAAGQMSASALSSINASIHAASSQSRSDTRSYGVSKSENLNVNDNNTFAIEHIYQHEDV